MPMITATILVSFWAFLFPILFDVGSLIFIGRTAGGLQGTTCQRKNHIVDLDRGRTLPKRLQPANDDSVVAREA
jgi:hypothetical protein